MLYPGEVGHGECNLDVHRPNYAGEHGCADRGEVRSLATLTEGLIATNVVDVDDENDNGCVDAIEHPTQDSFPVEEEVVRTLLV